MATATIIAHDTNADITSYASSLVATIVPSSNAASFSSSSSLPPSLASSSSTSSSSSLRGVLSPGVGRGRGRGRPRRNAASNAQQVMVHAELDEMEYKAEQKAVRAAKKAAVAKKKPSSSLSSSYVSHMHGSRRFGSNNNNSNNDSTSSSDYYNHINDDTTNNNDDDGTPAAMKSWSITDIMRRALPAGTSISDDARLAMQSAVDEFICFVTHEACDTHTYDTTKQVNHIDITAALRSLGMHEYAILSSRYADRYLEYAELRSDEWIGQLRDLYTLEDNDGQAHETLLKSNIRSSHNMLMTAPSAPIPPVIDASASEEVRRHQEMTYKQQSDQYVSRRQEWVNALVTWQEALSEIIERRNKLHSEVRKVPHRAPIISKYIGDHNQLDSAIIPRAAITYNQYVFPSSPSDGRTKRAHITAANGNTNGNGTAVKVRKLKYDTSNTSIDDEKKTKKPRIIRRKLDSDHDHTTPPAPAPAAAATPTPDNHTASMMTPLAVTSSPLQPVL